MDESKIPLGDAVVGMNSEIRGLYERYETAAPVMISCGVFTRPQSFAQWLVGQLGEHIAREAELQAEIERLMSLDGERCKSHNFYLIRSSRLEDEVARKQLDCDALTARIKTLEDALRQDIAKEELHIISCGGPTGLRNSMASALGLARNSIRHEILRMLTPEGESECPTE